MTLKDFSFKQLDKSARLEVGKVDKSNGKVHAAHVHCSTARGCTSYRK